MCRRGLQTSTLFKTWPISLACLRFWLWFVLFYIKNQVVFQTNITEIDTFEKSYWYCKCKLLIASLHSLFKASSPKTHCSRRLIIKFYTLFNTQDLVFSSLYLTCISQIRECFPPSKSAPLFSLELVLEQKHCDPITDIIRTTPFFTATLAFRKCSINIDSHVLLFLP